MIVSASRRTDVPCLYAEWFLHRVEAGFVRVRNPFNAAQVRTVSLRPEEVDCVVFWTKDPAPLLDKLSVLDARGLPYYFQFTLTPYGSEIEHNLRDKGEIAATFAALSRRIGCERVVWRYDPIVINEELTPAWHRGQFARLCDLLAEHTAGVTISFADRYAKVKTPLLRNISEAEMREVAGLFPEIAGAYGLPVNTCCEKIDLSAFGIGRAACVDRALVERLCGHPVAAGPDRHQRPGCGCAQSVDIGAYNTCGNGCVYCYAGGASGRRHEPGSDML